MFKVGLKGLLASKRRLIGTTSAILIGVAFLSATLILGDTMRAGFKVLFSQANENVAVVVRGATSNESDEISIRANVPTSLQPTLEDIGGVAEVAPEIVGLAQITGSDGKPLGGQGPPTFGAGWTDSDTSPWKIAEGRAPTAPDEVVIDQGAADLGNLAVGDKTIVRTPDPLDVTIVGIATFGEADSVGGATFTAFSFERAQELFIRNPNEVTRFAIVAAPGVTQDQLKEQIDQILPADTEAITGAELTKEQQGDIDAAFLDVFERFLLIFSLIALVVAAFSIYNTFSVILAQRTRESALLRAIGASRRQVLTSMACEALVIGLVASVLGLALGVVFAIGLRKLMDAFGGGLPTSGVDVTPNSIVIAIIAGLVITFLASVIPSIRASGVPPLAAIRDVSVDRSGTSKTRIIMGTILAVVGVGLVLLAALGGLDNSLLIVLPGAFLCLVTMVVMGPLAAKPGADVIGRAVQSIRGLPGRLARENSTRNPKRTANTAAALMVGIAIVALFTVFASSLKASFSDLIGKNFTGDVVVFSTNFGGLGFSPDLSREVGELPEVAEAAGTTYGIGKIDNTSLSFLSTDPAKYGAIVDPEVTAGSITELGPTEIAVASGLAQRNGWALGQEITMTFFDGAQTTLTVGAVFERAELVNSEMIVPIETWGPHNPQLSDQAIFITVADGYTVDQAMTAIQPLTTKFGAPDPLDKQGYIDLFSGQIDIFLTVIYVLLALSILIAVMGIANTLALSIYERTRELGLLRAVGQTRSQLRSMVRWESAIIALFGSLGGLLLGMFLGWGVMAAFENDEGLGRFVPPVGQLIVILIVGGLFGMLAGIMPARRAAKLDILESIAAEG